MRRKYGDEQLVDAVRNHLHGHLFHSTDAANLGSISEHGLLSARAAEELGIAPVYPGGNALTQTMDAGAGLDNVVFLSFFNLGVMPKHENDRHRRRVLLKIDARILYSAGTQVALGRASRRSTNVHRAAAAFYKMDWAAIAGQVDENDLRERWRLFQVYDYEILVPNRVPPEFILGIVE